MVENLLIRRIKVEDAADVGRIYAQITKSKEDIDFAHIIQQQVQREAQEGSFVAEVEGKIVGYMISYIVYAGYGLDKSAWIATLGVDPKYMGRGIGGKLAEEIFGVYRQKGVRHIFTSVRWDSVDLLSFFKSLGFDRSSFINLRKELDF